MVWEQESPLVIMLTTVVERGRVKCHKYWPDLDSTVLYGSISVTCTKEEHKDSFSFRDFTLVEVESGTERLVSQMQYLSWPDHGTPSDTVEFVEFVENVRDTREKSATVAPTIVHCRYNFSPVLSSEFSFHYRSLRSENQTDSFNTF